MYFDLLTLVLHFKEKWIVYFYSTFSIFHKEMDIAFIGLVIKLVVVYLDHVKYFSMDRNDLLHHLKIFFNRR